MSFRDESGSGRAGLAALQVAADPIRAAEDYWRDLRGRRRLPLRRDVDPGAIGRALAHLFLVHRRPGGQARFRVAGSAVSGRFGHDLRGLPFNTLFDTREAAVLDGYLAALLDEPAILRLAVRSGIADGEVAAFPMLGEDGLVSCALGAVSPALMAAPRDCRLTIARRGVRIEPIGLRALEGMAACMPRPARQRPALRLVVDNG